MARLTKVSPYRSGEPRFGRRSHTFDNSVKISYLTPEELEEYRNGNRGGSKLFTYEDYLKMKADGKKQEEIAKAMNISVATLYNRIKAWKEKAPNTPSQIAQKAPVLEEEVSETNNTTQGKIHEYEALMEELKAKMESSNKEKDEIIHGLEKKVEYWKSIAEKNDSQKVAELQAALNDSQAQLIEITHDKLTLGGKVHNLEQQLLQKDKQRHDLQTEYNELLEDYSVLKEEVTPLRQLVLINLREKAGVLT